MNFYSLSYFKFFARKISNYLLKRMELPIRDRKDIFFISHNDRIGSSIQSHGHYEREFLACVEFLVEYLDIRDTTAVDVGANIGNHTLYLSRLFQTVLAFEPSPYLSLVLQANVIRNQRENVEVFSCGLADVEGIATVRELSTENIGMVELDRTHSEAGSSTIELRRGDDFLLGKETRVGFVKVDVEGMELEVLQGMKRSLSRDKPLIAFESRNGKEGGRVIQWLFKIGYIHLYEIQASRIFGKKDSDLSSLLSFRKNYRIKKVDTLEDRFYTVVFASVNDLAF